MAQMKPPLVSGRTVETEGFGLLRGQVVALGGRRELPGAHVVGEAVERVDADRLEVGVAAHELGGDPVFDAEHVVEHEHLAVGVRARRRCRSSARRWRR